MVAEYNRHWIYHGWHLYLRDNNEGRPNRDTGWGWLRGSLCIEPVREFMLANDGCDAPTTYDGPGAAVSECDAVVKEFVRRWHRKSRKGVRIWVNEWGRYSLTKPASVTHTSKHW